MPNFDVYYISVKIFSCGSAGASPARLDIAVSVSRFPSKITAATRSSIPGISILLFFSFLFLFQGKFQAFYQYAKTFNSDDFDYEDLKNGDYVFMRWKVNPACLLL